MGAGGHGWGSWYAGSVQAQVHHGTHSLSLECHAVHRTTLALTESAKGCAAIALVMSCTCCAACKGGSGNGSM